MRKRMLSLVLAAILCLSLLPFGAAAEEKVTSGTWGPNGTWDIDAEGTLTIRGNEDATSDDFAFKSTPFEWRNNPDIKTIVFALGVKYVPALKPEKVCDYNPAYSAGFQNNVNLKTVYISATLETYLYGANFIGCTSLEEFQVHPVSEKFRAFDGALYSKYDSTYKLIACPAKITELNMPDGTESIYQGAVYSCPDLTKVTIPASMTSYIYDWNFVDCPRLNTITVRDGSNYYMKDGCLCYNRSIVLAPKNLSGIFTVPESVDRIYSWAFSRCAGLKALYLHSNIQIYDGAFAHCSGLTELTVPGPISKLGISAFADCTSLSSVVISEGNTQISERMFSGCTALKQVTLPKSLKTVGQYAFEGCTALPDIKLQDAATDLRPGIFSGCTALKNVFLPDGLKVLPWKCFQDCTSLTSVDLPDGLETINSDAFSGCTSLNGQKLPGGLTSLGVSVFEGCTSLQSLSLPANIKEVPSRCFFGCENLRSVGFPKDVTKINRYAFSGCSSLVELPLPDTLEEIGIGAFRFCSSLKSITIPASVVSMDLTIRSGDDMIHLFDGCDSLENLTILAKITEIDQNAFSGLPKLKSVQLPDTVVSIWDAAFANCPSLEKIVLPNSVRTLGWGVFLNCTGLKDVTLSTRLSDPGLATFSGCTGVQAFRLGGESSYLAASDGVLYNKDMTKVILFPPGRGGVYTIPEGVTIIGTGAFKDCKLLTELKLPNTLRRIEAGAMDNMSLKEITIPAGVGSISKDSLSASITDIYYEGTEAEWNQIVYDPLQFQGVTIHFIPKPTPTPTPTATPAPTAQPTAKPTATPTPTAKPTTSPAPTAKPTAAPAPTAKPTAAPAPTAKPTATPAPTAKPTATPAPTAKPTATPAPASNPFNDVSKDQYYYDPVLWAVNHDPQITAGTSATTFSPENPCTRGQMVTFLWRAKGCPEPKLTKNPFTDVKSLDYFYKAVLWAVENEITAGTSKTTFSPAATVTRAQTVTFLWRTEGKPAVQTKNPFTDVPAGQYYTDAVLWAVKNNITAGTSATTFSPSNPCTRGQIVTFLYRDMK